MAIAMLAATALKAYGQYQEANSQASMLHERANLSEERGRETLFRMRVNNMNLARESREFQGRQRATAAASGTDVGSGSNLLALENTASIVAEQMAINKREAEFERWMLEKETTSTRQQATDIKEASKLGMFTTAFQGLVGAYQTTSTKDGFSTSPRPSGRI